MISKRNILALEVRKRIYNFILKNPGLHEREISRQIGIPKSTLKHHLNYLIKQDLVILKNFGNYNKYFIGRKLSKWEKEILDLIRKQTPRRIILCLYAGAACSQIELSKILERHPTSIETYLKKFIDLAPKFKKYLYHLCYLLSKSFN